MCALRRIAILTVVLLAAVPASASALSATNARIAEHPGFVRVVIDFTGGTLEVNEADATDPVPSDGTARVVVRGMSGLHGPERLVLDLYGAKPPSAAAEIRVGRNGCLRLTAIARDGRGFRVRGVERDLFEGSFVLRVRDASGRVVGTRTMTARGSWSARVAYRVTRAGSGTVEAVAASAKDGSLACLVQRRVALRP